MLVEAYMDPASAQGYLDVENRLLTYIRPFAGVRLDPRLAGLAELSSAGEPLPAALSSL